MYDTAEVEFPDRTAHFKEPFLHKIYSRMETCKDMFSLPTEASSDRRTVGTAYFEPEHLAP
jgi:hypothetical protein